MTVYTYQWVQELRNSYKNDEEISQADVRKLEKYVRQKSKVANRPDGEWSRKQLLKAKRLLRQLKKDKDMLLEAEAQ